MRVGAVGVFAGAIVSLIFAVANASDNKPKPSVPQPLPWNASAKIVTSEYEYHEPTNQSRNQQFGAQIALSGDGLTMAVADAWYFGGSEWPWYASGAVYVYRLTARGWTFEAQLQPPAARGYDFFGSDLALDFDGNLLVVGAQNEGYDAPSQAAGPGSAFVYKRRGGRWFEEAMLRPSRPQDGAQFGRNVEVSALGDVIAVAAPYETVAVDGLEQVAAGAVYVFTKRAGIWSEQHAVTAPNPQADDLFGWGVRLSEYGRTLAVLAAEQNFATEDWDVGGWPGRNNTVYVFDRWRAAWNLTAEFEGSANDSQFGGTAYESEGQTEGFDLSADGRTLAIASPFVVAASGSGAGLVRIYRRRGQQWAAAGVLRPTLPERRSFGIRLTLSANGRTLVAFADRDDGAYGQPYVVAFDEVRDRWKQTAIFESPGPQIATGFANSLALSWNGKRFALGARVFSTETSWWGAALIYRRQAPMKP